MWNNITCNTLCLIRFWNPLLLSHQSFTCSCQPSLFHRIKIFDPWSLFQYGYAVHTSPFVSESVKKATYYNLCTHTYHKLYTQMYMYVWDLGKLQILYENWGSVLAVDTESSWLMKGKKGKKKQGGY